MGVIIKILNLLKTIPHMGDTNSLDQSGMSYTVKFNPVQWPELTCIVTCTDIYKLK